MASILARKGVHGCDLAVDGAASRRRLWHGAAVESRRGLRSALALPLDGAEQVGEGVVLPVGTGCHREELLDRGASIDERAETQRARAGLDSDAAERFRDRAVR